MIYILSSLKRRYQYVETEKLYALGTVLDPRFKGSVFLRKENLEQAQSALIAEISDIYSQLNCNDMPSSDHSEETPLN